MTSTTTMMRARSAGLCLLTAMTIPAAAAIAQTRATLPAGVVIPVRTVEQLNSATVRAGQQFETRVESDVAVEGYLVIPAGSRIRGAVTVARPANRQESGVIEVVFDRLVFADGTGTPIRGKLTSTDTAERRQIEADPNARVVLVGGRGGIGAAIAGAGTGRSQNSILSALGAMLSEGMDVNVPAGTLLAVALERPLTLQARGILRDNTATLLTAADMVRAAQDALSRLNYYRGPINGRLDDATRRALFEFQADRRLSTTGNLDARTAEALGIARLAGFALSAEEASAVRRESQSLASRFRTHIGASSVGRLDQSRSYTEAELELWFGLSAFYDNASIYEQVVRNGGHRDASILAGRSLAAAARRVDAAMRTANPPAAVVDGWRTIRQQLMPLGLEQ